MKNIIKGVFFNSRLETGFLKSPGIKISAAFWHGQKSDVLKSAIAEAHARLDGEATRLKKLRKLNPGVRLEEIEIAEHFVEKVIRHIAEAHLRLDGVRLVLANL